MNTICGVVLKIIQKVMYDFAIEMLNVMVVIFSKIGSNITTTTNHQMLHHVLFILFNIHPHKNEALQLSTFLIFSNILSV